MALPRHPGDMFHLSCQVEAAWPMIGLDAEPMEATPLHPEQPEQALRFPHSPQAAQAPLGSTPPGDQEHGHRPDSSKGVRGQGNQFQEHVEALRGRRTMMGHMSSEARPMAGCTVESVITHRGKEVLTTQIRAL